MLTLHLKWAVYFLLVPLEIMAQWPEWTLKEIKRPGGVVTWGLQGHSHLMLYVFLLVKTPCFSRREFNTLLCTSLLHDWMEIKRSGHWSFLDWMQQLLNAETPAEQRGEEKKQVDDGWYWYSQKHPHLTLSSRNGFHLCKIHYFCLRKPLSFHL